MLEMELTVCIRSWVGAEMPSVMSYGANDANNAKRAKNAYRANCANYTNIQTIQTAYPMHQRHAQILVENTTYLAVGLDAMSK